MTILLGILAWSLILVMGVNLAQFLIAGSKVIQRMHKIPCSECTYFTQESCLKCTIQPHWAGTEEAIHCSDFETQILR